MEGSVAAVVGEEEVFGARSDDGGAEKLAEREVRLVDNGEVQDGVASGVDKEAGVGEVFGELWEIGGGDDGGELVVEGRFLEVAAAGNADDGASRGDEGEDGGR